MPGLFLCVGVFPDGYLSITLCAWMREKYRQCLALTFPRKAVAKKALQRSALSPEDNLSAKTLIWAVWFESISVAGGYPVGFIWTKTCKMVTQESDFLWGSGSDDADETKSSSLTSYLPLLKLSLSLLKPALSLGSAGTQWAVNQVTKPPAKRYQNADS